MEPAVFIDSVRGIFGRYKKDSGGCLKFALMLYSLYPGSDILYNSLHAIVKIGENHYDVDGIVENVENFISLTQYGEGHILNSFSEHLNTTDKQLLKSYSWAWQRT
jgi:hypothetical protein